jgi:zinc transport system ATP-binding protein
MEIVLSGFAGRMGLRPFYRRREKLTALENLARTGAEALKDRCFRELSGGQKRRVLIARALCASEKLLILDEPASGLDPQGQTELYALLENLNRETGIAVVMVSHDGAAVTGFAGTVLHVQGRQLFYGKTADWLDSAEGKSFFTNRIQKEDHDER